MLMYEIASQNVPFFEEDSAIKVSEAIAEGKRPCTDIPGMPWEYCLLMSQAWHQDPDQRRTMSQISSKLYELFMSAYGPNKTSPPASEPSYPRDGSFKTQTHYQ